MSRIPKTFSIYFNYLQLYYKEKNKNKPINFYRITIEFTILTNPFPRTTEIKNFSKARARKPPRH